MNVKNSTARILDEIEYLDKNSRENEPIVIKDLLDYLHESGYKTERCTLLKDLNELKKHKMGVIHKARKYFYQKSVFSAEEQMLITDSICYSNYIDNDSSEKIISKLITLALHEEGEKIKRQSNISVKPKPMNPLCISNAGKLYKAIVSDNKIRFGYLHYNKEKRLIPKDNFQKTVSPYKLVWDNSQYYLVGLDDEKGSTLVSFRVDKLFDLVILDDKREPLKGINSCFLSDKNTIDTEKYLKSIFFMYGSEKNRISRVVLNVRESAIGAFIDKFGEEIPVKLLKNDWIEICICVQPSPTFYGWLSQFGGSVKILTPHIRKEYMEHLKNILKIYNG